MSELSESQQRYIDTVIDACNATKYRSISPGIVGQCDQCRSDFEIDDAEEFNRLVEAGELFDEGGFSWRSCDACGTALGGDRYAAHGFDENDAITHYDICADCLCYLANGDVPERPYE